VGWNINKTDTCSHVPYSSSYGGLSISVAASNVMLSVMSASEYRSGEDDIISVEDHDCGVVASINEDYNDLL